MPNVGAQLNSRDNRSFLIGSVAFMVRRSVYRTTCGVSCQTGLAEFVERGADTLAQRMIDGGFIVSAG